jgi:hypothetical protein
MLMIMLSSHTADGAAVVTCPRRYHCQDEDEAERLSFILPCGRVWHTQVGHVRITHAKNKKEVIMCLGLPAID